jgi:hypothetical protein
LTLGRHEALFVRGRWETLRLAVVAVGWSWRQPDPGPPPGDHQPPGHLAVLRRDGALPGQCQLRLAVNADPGQERAGRGGHRVAGEHARPFASRRGRRQPALPRRDAGVSRSFGYRRGGRAGLGVDGVSDPQVLLGQPAVGQVMVDPGGLDAGVPGRAWMASSAMPASRSRVKQVWRECGRSRGPARRGPGRRRRSHPARR